MKYYIYDKEVPDPNAQQFIDESNGDYQGCPNFCIWLYICIYIYIYLYIHTYAFILHVYTHIYIILYIIYSFIIFYFFLFTDLFHTKETLKQSTSLSINVFIPNYNCMISRAEWRVTLRQTNKSGKKRVLRLFGTNDPFMKDKQRHLVVVTCKYILDIFQSDTLGHVWTHPNSALITLLTKWGLYSNRTKKLHIAVIL